MREHPANVRDNAVAAILEFGLFVSCGEHNHSFKNKQCNLWSTFFGNDSQAPWREKPAISRVDCDKDGRVKVADKKSERLLSSSEA